ncbi:hypothetical protein [Streptomyces chrestomyceticus]|uniref:hypothetical protein n=1 Tax=Streptomyces chrestomyceticus TaxID=68185 RepID=UPI0037A2ACD3
MVARAPLPAPRSAARVRSEGVVGGNRALLFPPAGLEPPARPEGVEEALLTLGEVRAIALEPRPEDDYELALEAWAVEAERSESSVLGQLEEGPHHNTAMNFGGAGRAYAFVCEPCNQALFLWQC